MQADQLFKLFEKGVDFAILVVAYPCAYLSLGYEAVEPLSQPVFSAGKSVWSTTDTFFSAMRVPEGVFEYEEEQTVELNRS